MRLPGSYDIALAEHTLAFIPPLGALMFLWQVGRGTGTGGQRWFSTRVARHVSLRARRVIEQGAIRALATVARQDHIGPIDLLRVDR